MPHEGAEAQEIRERIGGRGKGTETLHDSSDPKFREGSESCEGKRRYIGKRIRRERKR